MSKRLAVLEAMIERGSQDAFAWYALALEYSSAQRYDDALRTFSALRDKDPSYVPMYLMCGNMLSKAARPIEARAWLVAGMEVARAKGDAHALGELETALDALGEG